MILYFFWGKNKIEIVFDIYGVAQKKFGLFWKHVGKHFSWSLEVIFLQTILKIHMEVIFPFQYGGHFPLNFFENSYGGHFPLGHFPMEVTFMALHTRTYIVCSTRRVPRFPSNQKNSRQNSLKLYYRVACTYKLKPIPKCKARRISYTFFFKLATLNNRRE